MTARDGRGLISLSSPHEKNRKRTAHQMKASFFLLPPFTLVFFALLRFGHLAFLGKNSPQPPPPSLFLSPDLKRETHVQPRPCDLFSGKWIYDETSHPLYKEEDCPYIQPQLTCQEHGRPDNGYQHWRWQPNACNLPRFNASMALEMLRGKRMMFVGDSLNRGHFTSMVCLLQTGIPEEAKSMKTYDSLSVFQAKEYNATVEFYWAPFLLESNSDNALVHRITDRVVRWESIQGHGRHWLGADVIIFNTYLWWMTGAPMKITKGSLTGEGNKNNITSMRTEEAYRMAVRSAVRWAEEHMDSRKNRVFFSTPSPSHDTGSKWGGNPDDNCYNETKPTEDPAYLERRWSRSMMAVLREETEKSAFPISILNITRLSECRKDAHTQIYKKQWSPPTEEQLANPKSYADCIHWCLPGLPDIWNELLYSQLFFPLHTEWEI